MEPVLISRRQSTPAPAGFSLAELLVVITLMGILAAIAMPAVNSLVQSNNITQAGQLLSDQFEMARQIAAVHNRTVEVRLLRVGTDNQYNAVQVWVPDKDAAYHPASRLASLPAGIVISQNSTGSPFLNDLTESSMPAGAGITANAPYRAFRIRPDGVIEPIPATANRTKLYFTLVDDRHASSASLPDNYATVQLNPDTGSAQIYRP